MYHVAAELDSSFGILCTPFRQRPLTPASTLGGGGGARALIGINPAVLDDDGAAIERSKLPCFAARLPPCDVLRARGHVRNSQDVAPKDLIISDQVRVQ